MLMQAIFWILLGGSLFFSFLLFRDLADITQWWLKVDRAVVMRTWRRRHEILASVLLCGGGALLIHVGAEVGNIYVVSGILTVAAIGVLAGYFNPGWMMRSAQHSAGFVSVDEASRFIPQDYEIVAVEKDGVARAYADFELWRPHIVGDAQGLNGDNIVMTYCALTNLGVAFEPVIDGAPVELRVMTQLQNNLVMWDKNSGEPIQQLWGARESDGAQGSAMRQHPSFKLPFGKFAAAYPHGRVFKHRRTKALRNPLLALYDLFWDAQFYMAIHKQKQQAEPIFPTLERQDDRLPVKTQVWGFTVGDDFVCYTPEYVRANGGLINTNVGGQAVVIHWDDAFESLGVWYNDFGVNVTRLDFFGASDIGELQRVETVKAGCFYGMWYTFFPTTDVNRPAESAESQAA
jgi:hypothetical protein